MIAEIRSQDKHGQLRDSRDMSHSCHAVAHAAKWPPVLVMMSLVGAVVGNIIIISS